MAEAQSTSGDGDGGATDDYKSWSCDSNCGVESVKGEFDDDISVSHESKSFAGVAADGKQRQRSIMAETAADLKERRRRRQKLANKDSLVCQVCGDKANGYNFGAVTCESCKAFFRRNALKNLDIKCNFESICKIDPFTRKFCTACRLHKCFNISMKKEWILDDESLKKRKKLSRRSQEQLSTDNHDSPVEGTTSSSRFQHDHLASADSNSSSGPTNVPSVPTVMLPHASIMQLGGSSITSTGVVGGTWGGGIGGPSLVSLPLSSPGAAAADACPTAPSSSSSPLLGGSERAPSPGEKALPLSEEDSRVIADILMHHAQTIDPFDRPYWSKVTVEQPSRPQEVFNMADGFIRRLIKFVKAVPEFSSLCQEDQIALLKGGIMETLVIRSAISYDPSIGGFKIASAESSEQRDLKISMIFRGLGEDMYAEHMKFITSFNTIAKWNKTVILLAMVINLFSPDRPGLGSTTKVAVAAAEERYSQLLHRYLYSLHPSHEASAMYPRLLMKLTDVRSYGEMSSRQVARVSATDMEPLMKEIFNVK